uniref:Uncharacterized protein n=1 Tax=Arundo donax TaxID=35708 RepID=A0A0A9C967_ARUDO
MDCVSWFQDREAVVITLVMLSNVQGYHVLIGNDDLIQPDAILKLVVMLTT